MNKKTLRLFLLVMAVLMTITTTGCGMRYMVKGKVIDMDTGQPVEGAVVSILWEKVNEWLPGLGTSWDVLEQFDCFTGPDGEFKIPKRASVTDSFLSYRMAVYKKGYVCWDNQKVFPRCEGCKFTDRVGFKLKHDMTIELEPFKEQYSKKLHASFVRGTISRSLDKTRNSKLYEATKEERDFYDSLYKHETLYEKRKQEKGK